MELEKDNRLTEPKFLFTPGCLRVERERERETEISTSTSLFPSLLQSNSFLFLRSSVSSSRALSLLEELSLSTPARRSQRVQTSSSSLEGVFLRLARSTDADFFFENNGSLIFLMPPSLFFLSLSLAPIRPRFVASVSERTRFDPISPFAARVAVKRAENRRNAPALLR